MIPKETMKQLLVEGFKYAKAAIKKDHEARYSLKGDWVLPAVNGLICDYDDDALSVVTDERSGRTLIMVKAFESTREDPKCDGASCAPDVFLGVSFVAAAVFHDRWYDRMSAMSRETGIPEAELRKWGDKIFASIVYAENGKSLKVKTVNSLYYYVLRGLGGFYHRNKETIRKSIEILVISALASVMCSGCSGCVGTVFDEGEEYDPPIVLEVEP